LIYDSDLKASGHTSVKSGQEPDATNNVLPYWIIWTKYKIMSNKHSTNYRFRLIILTLLLSAIYIISGFVPINSLWGFNHLKYFPKYVSIIYAILLLLFIIPFVADRIVVLLNKLSCHFQKLPKSIRIIIISIIAGAVFYSLRVHVHSLGDGYQRIFEIENGLLYYHTEPFDFFIHAIFSRIILLFGINSAELAYVIISIASGIIFVNSIYLFRFPKQIESSTAILIKILIIASGGLQIYFGYVESYSLYYLFSLLFLLWSTKYLMSGRGLIAATIMLSLAIVSHITALFLLPGYLYLVYYNPKNIKPISFKNKYLPILIVGLVLGGLTYLEIRLQFFVDMFTTSYTSVILPIFSPTEYSILSLQHLYDILNQILLISPFCFIFVAYIFPLKRQETNNKNLHLFLLIIIICALLTMLTIDPLLGYARDWDLFSTPAAILGLSSCILLLFRGGIKSISKYSAFVIVSISILFLSGWILINSSEQKQLNRAHDLLSLSNKGIQYCTELLAYYYRHKKKDNQKAIELYQSVNNFGSNPRLSKKLGDAQKDLGYYNDAEQSYKNALVKEPNNPNLLNKIGQVFIKQERYDTAIDILNKAHRIAPDTTSIIEALALAYIHKNEYEKALSLADTLFSKDANSPGASLIKLTISARKGDWSTVRIYYKEFLKYGKGRSDYETMRDYYKNLK